MCAILDNDVVGLVFGKDRPPAAQAFFTWIDSGRGRLVVGGKLLRELDGTREFRRWRRQAVLAGRIRLLNDEAVDGRASELERQGACRSRDWHVVAIAQLSGARLLYSNDDALRDDFRDRTLIGGLRGRVYSTRCQKELTRVHRSLLGNRDLCARRGRAGDDT